jgi:hypothetical protein
MLRHIFLAAIVIAAPLPALADDRANMEAFMAEYLKVWNAHDAAAITSTYYRLDGDHAWSTPAGMEAEFARLRGQGYATSDIKSVTGCMLTPDTGQVELRYIRLTTDGGFMPPRDRASIYQLRKFPDGWRITSFAGMPAEQKMECPG